MPRKSKSASDLDAVAQATRIIVGDCPPVIDWNSEPASATEALMRRMYIERFIRRNGLHKSLLHLMLLPRTLLRRPSDLAHAISILETAYEEVERKRQDAETVAMIFGGEENVEGDCDAA